MSRGMFQQKDNAIKLLQEDILTFDEGRKKQKRVDRLEAMETKTQEKVEQINKTMIDLENKFDEANTRLDELRDADLDLEAEVEDSPEEEEPVAPEQPEEPENAEGEPQTDVLEDAVNALGEPGEEVENV